MVQGKKYYDSLYGEAEIVATAYTNFGNRYVDLTIIVSSRDRVHPHAQKATKGFHFDRVRTFSGSLTIGKLKGSFL